MFFQRRAVKECDGVNVAVGHAEDIVSLVDEIGGEHPAALFGDVDAKFLEGADREFAGREAIDSADAGGEDAELGVPFRCMPEEALRHGAAANISRANEQDGLHFLKNFEHGRVSVAVWSPRGV